MNFLILLVVFANCGARKARLAGGRKTEIGDFPFVAVSLHPRIRCTASIIHPSWTLSAAHCYVIQRHRVKEEDVLISAGIVDFNDSESTSRQDRIAKLIIVHPRFKEVIISSSDLSLVNVDPFEITNEVHPIELSGEPFRINRNVHCTALGWGDTSTSRSNTFLHVLNVVAVQSKDTCHGLSNNERINMLCLKNDDGKGLCDGDSGGPLICDEKLVGVAHQVYVEKFKYKGQTDMRCGSKSVVHTYMFICPYLDWIKFYVPLVPDRPCKCFESKRKRS